jgi:hypothetical protein
MAEDRCEECGGRLDRPGLYGCDDGHPPRDTVWEIVAAIEGDLGNRRGLGLGTLDDELQDAIREAWSEKIRAILEPKGSKP